MGNQNSHMCSAVKITTKPQLSEPGGPWTSIPVSQWPGRIALSHQSCDRRLAKTEDLRPQVSSSLKCPGCNGNFCPMRNQENLKLDEKRESVDITWMALTLELCGKDFQSSHHKKGFSSKHFSEHVCHK